jgi:hypothetical protein
MLSSFGPFIDDLVEALCFSVAEKRWTLNQTVAVPRVAFEQ